jgi:1-phosphofructokinase family hexose kinase
MILTVTPNTALDKVLFVEDFSFGQTVRAQMSAQGMGGKGAVVSWVLGQLGTPSIATGLAAGETGQRMEAMLRAAGVRTDFVWVAGETRTNYVLVRVRDGVQGTVTLAGFGATAQDALALAQRVEAHLAEARVLLCGGSLPAGMPVDWYAPLIRQAKARGIVTVLDTSDQFLAPNLVVLPDIIKPNASEASTLLGCAVETPQDALAAVRALRGRGIGAPIITLGEQGAVAGSDEGIYYVPPIPVRVVNTAGAGDGFNAGLLQWRLHGESWEQSLRRAAAVATAILLTPGTGVCNPEDVERLMPQARVERMDY